MPKFCIEMLPLFQAKVFTECPFALQVRAREDEQIPAAQPSPELCSQPDYAVAWWDFRTAPQIREKLKEEGLSCKGNKEELKACNSLRQFLKDIFASHSKP